MHYARIDKGTIKVGEDVILLVDGENRARIRATPLATHLMHAALRKKLGAHVTQKGSLVSAERLRFDISQPVPIPAEALAEIEAEVNRRIRLNEEAVTRLMSPQEAMEKGAMALFGEKYGDEVRVVSMGSDDGQNFSVELCGGTHVKRTGDIGVFKIVSESALAAGVRRIEALTGAAALEHFAAQEKSLNDVAEALKSPIAEAATRVTQLVDERRKLEREVTDLRRQVAMGDGNGAASKQEEARKINGINFVSRVLTDIPAKDLKPMADAFKAQIKSGVIALTASFEGKVSLVVAVTDDLTAKINAVELVKVGAQVLGGKGGGGRADMAQAGGTNESGMPIAITAIEKALAG